MAQPMSFAEFMMNDLQQSGQSLSPQAQKKLKEYIQKEQETEAIKSLASQGAVNIQTLAEENPILANQILSSGEYQPTLTDTEQDKQKNKLAAAQKISELEEQLLGQGEGRKPQYSIPIPYLNKKWGETRAQLAEQGMNEPLARYMNTIQTLRPYLAKTSGQTGTMTEAEQEAAIALIKNTYKMSKKDAIQAYKELRNVMGLEGEVGGGVKVKTSDDYLKEAGVK